MKDHTTGGSHREERKLSNAGLFSEKRLPLLFTGILMASVIGYLTMRQLWIGFIFAHLGGLSIVGLFACLAGVLARRKNYSYRKAFFIGLCLPVILGFAGVLVIFPPNPDLACGGSASLGASLLIVLFYAALRKKEVTACT